jgi:hypothetical protein
MNILVAVQKNVSVRVGHTDIKYFANIFNFNR